MIIKSGKRIDGCTDTVPVGTIQPFVGLVPPSGYLVCQGQKVSKTTYPKLYEICGDLFGKSTEEEFYLPDLRGKTIVGYDADNSTLNTLGALIGAATHTHTSAAHVHSVDGHTHTSAAHTHTIAGHTHTSAAHTHTTGNHTLTVAEMPSHNHPILANKDAGGDHAAAQHTWGTAYQGYDTNSCGYTGGSGAHNHGNTGSTTPGNTGSTSLTSNSTTPGATGSTTLTTKSTTPGNTGNASNYQPSITMNWIVKAVMLIPEYFIVENSLTSPSSENALSAAQGKILNEKIDARATYSLEEKIIGSWVNGKPLYRLVIQYIANPDNNYYAVMNNPTASAIIMKIENMARLDTFVENGTVIVPLPSNGDYDCRVYIQRSYGGLGVIATANSVENFREKQITAILEYTKTTD